MTRHTEELSGETKDLVEQSVESSDYLTDDDSLDEVFAHLARSYVIRGGESEALSDKQEAIDRKQEELRETYGADTEERYELSTPDSSDDSSLTERQKALKDKVTGRS